ncbi:MAG: GAF domain-containing protein [Deltaproteobacteria bacterium]|nr:GAF domain-containing protein [Deltaproteobacteria bacterium]
MSLDPEAVAVDPSRLRLLYELACAFAARLDLDDLVTLVVEKCRSTLEAEGASVLLHDRASDELFFPFVVARDPAVAARLARLRFPADQGIAGTVLQSGTTLRVDDATSDTRLFRGADEQTGTTTRSLLCAPLITREGTIGVLQIVNHRGGTPFPAEDERFLLALAGSVAVAIDNARMYATLRDSEERLKIQVGALRRDLARQDRFTQIVGTSPAMAGVFELMESAAAAPITVLIEGETGTGKELVAQGIHKASSRAEHPFVAVNCAALPETLLESELFGHRRGAFTGATHDRVGLFEAARGGTIFLDEVGEMPAVMQAKLLRVLQEGEIVPVGDNRPRKIDVRVISATNRDLAREVEQRTFREDLFYRLSTFPIHLPPLRERREDVGPIATRMVESVARRYQKEISGIASEALSLLERWDWPGNVRELQNEIERAAALARAGEPITSAQLSGKLTGATPRPVGPSSPSPPRETQESEAPPSSGGADLGTLRDARSTFEADFIRRTLAAQDGNITRAARAMGLSRVALQKKMKDHGLR